MGKRKEFIGMVTSAKMQKTLVVKVMQQAKHPKYGRIMKTYNKFKVHDEKGTAKEGDTVKIVETRPLSKDKRFYLAQVVEKSKTAHIQVKEEA